GEQFRRNSGLELSGAVGTHNPMHLLLKRPLNTWTEADLLDFFEFFKALSQWPKERFSELSGLYCRIWGDVDSMDNEKLSFIVELGWRAAGIDAGDIARMTVEKANGTSPGSRSDTPLAISTQN